MFAEGWMGGCGWKNLGELRVWWIEGQEGAVGLRCRWL